MVAKGEELTERYPTVILVEDDPSVLRALRRMIVSFGLEVLVFARPSELQAITIPDSNTCLMFDVHATRNFRRRALREAERSGLPVTGS